jgi:undecaprenyl-diphosphatase
LALAVAISYSRIYVGVHYPTDVLSGALLGLFAGWLAAFIVDRLGNTKHSEGG